MTMSACGLVAFPPELVYPILEYATEETSCNAITDWSHTFTREYRLEWYHRSLITKMVSRKFRFSQDEK